MHHITKISALALGIAGVLAFGQAQASGFQLREQSVKNLGRSNAGSIVGKNDASVVSLNPAGMANVDKNTVQADLTVIDLDADFAGSGQVLAGTPLARPVSGGNGGDPGDPTLVPNISAVFPLHGALEGVVVGASIGAPFGLKTEYDPSWMGRYRAIESDVKTEDLTLSVAIWPPTTKPKSVLSPSTWKRPSADCGLIGNGASGEQLAAPPTWLAHAMVP